jgi:hypothetical protein
VSAFLAFALLLSKILLLSARHWSMYLPSRRILHANLNAALLVAVGFAAASGLVCFWAGHKGTIASCVSKRLRSAWFLLGKGKSALQRIPFPRKLIFMLVLCCALAAGSFWAYHSRRSTVPPATSEAPQQPHNLSAAAQAVHWDDESAAKGQAGVASLSDIQGPVQAAPKGIDFSDLGGKPVQTAPKRAITKRHADTAAPAIDRSQRPAGFDKAVPPSSAVPLKRTAHTQAVDERPTTYNSLPTGTRITPDIGTNGHGMLAVNNGTSLDAVVRLYDVATHQTMRWFWVQAHSSAQVGQLPEGTYTLAYTRGLDWLESEDAFRWHPSYSEFGKPLQYTEQRDSEGVRYDDIRVTLHAVTGGNVRTKAISREEFLKGHRHTRLQR